MWCDERARTIERTTNRRWISRGLFVAVLFVAACQVDVTRSPDSKGGEKDESFSWTLGLPSPEDYTAPPDPLPALDARKEADLARRPHLKESVEKLEAAFADSPTGNAADAEVDLDELREECSEIFSRSFDSKLIKLCIRLIYCDQYPDSVQDLITFMRRPPPDSDAIVDREEFEWSNYGLYSIFVEMAAAGNTQALQEIQRVIDFQGMNQDDAVGLRTCAPSVLTIIQKGVDLSPRSPTIKRFVEDAFAEERFMRRCGRMVYQSYWMFKHQEISGAESRNCRSYCEIFPSPASNPMHKCPEKRFGIHSMSLEGTFDVADPRPCLRTRDLDSSECRSYLKKKVTDEGIIIDEVVKTQSPFAWGLVNRMSEDNFIGTCEMTILRFIREISEPTTTSVEGIREYSRRCAETRQEFARVTYSPKSEIEESLSSLGFDCRARSLVWPGVSSQAKPGFSQDVIGDVISRLCP